MGKANKHETSVNIALTFSGGGYRAAAFHLGTLSFLHHIKTPDDTLLSHVKVLSTVSGGTITGLRYMQALAHGEDIDEMTRSIYAFFFDVDMMAMALQQLDDDYPQEGASTIRTMAHIYDEKLFHQATFADFIGKMSSLPVKHFSANATDFSNSIPFRFQATETIGDSTGVFGNSKHVVPDKAAEKVTLGEAMACSSCFPGGFEPMVFPDDFALASTEEGKELKNKYGSFGIMDGGCVDNQGIEPVLLAEERMQKKQNIRGKALDLVIVSDVSSPYMDAYEPYRGSLPSFVRKLTLKRIGNWMLGATALMAALLIGSFFLHSHLLVCVLAVLFSIIAILTIAYRYGRSQLASFLSGTFISHGVSDLMNLSVGNIVSLVANRARSLGILVTGVFMKHIRRKEYSSLYDDGWATRTITNAIYALRPDELWAQRQGNQSLPDNLQPSEAMQQVSVKAAAMGTTLWFTDEDKATQMPRTIIACGQFTTCYNLLCYLHDQQKKGSTIPARMALLTECEEQLLQAWEKFRQNPYWLVDVIIG